jgi:broad specificity phosphatase PhoE
MKILLIRHAQSVANADGKWQGQLDYPLSPNGERQAFLLSKRLSLEKFNPTYIYSSPLKRALRTAEIVFPKKRIVKIDDLKENGIGIFEGKSLQEVKKLYPDVAKKFILNQNFSAVPNAELRTNIKKRAEKIINFLVKEHNEKEKIAVFTHSGFLVFLIAVFLKTNQIWRLNIPNTGIFHFDVDPNTWDTEGINEFGPTHCQIISFANADHLVV